MRTHLLGGDGSLLRGEGDLRLGAGDGERLRGGGGDRGRRPGLGGRLAGLAALRGGGDLDLRLLSLSLSSRSFLLGGGDGRRGGGGSFGGGGSLEGGGGDLFLGRMTKFTLHAHDPAQRQKVQHVRIHQYRYSIYCSTTTFSYR